ncbi:sigma-70 family RNA polymerase sigma factor [Candidatus Korobacter versatilis]|nr:sigma-70 family RNA polymerase sigma factor [Candidatus Koribacter versatilis]
MGTNVTHLDRAPEPSSGSHQSAVEELTNIFVDRWRSLYRIARRQLENRADAEDAVQDAFLSAYTHLDQFKRQAQMSTWVTTILINSARMKLRGRPRQVHVSFNDQPQDNDCEPFYKALRDRRPSPEEVTQQNELTEQAGLFSERLSPSLRATFQLRDIYGESVRDTAAILGVHRRGGQNAARQGSLRAQGTDATHPQ